jgi:CHAT domain-containing protein
MPCPGIRHDPFEGDQVLRSGYLELSFTRQGANAYIARIKSDLGSAEETFELPSPEVLEDKLIAVEAAVMLSSSPPVRRGRPTAVELPARRFGEFLFKSVFKGTVHTHLEYFLNQARENDVDVMLGVQASTTELARMPWELMFDITGGDYLGFKADIVRYLGASPALTSASVELPLQVLVVVASPTDHQELDVDNERASLESALHPLVEQGLVELSWLEEPGWTALNHKLQERKWHVFHFIGHGGHDVNRAEGFINLVNPATGRSDRIMATDLGRLLTKQRQLRLAVLNACDTGRSDPEEHQMSVAETLVRNDVPGVVAMQYSISDSAAKAFTQVFYSEVSAGRAANKAMSAARLALTRHFSGTLEWATPVLFLKHPTSAVFSLQSRKPVTMELDADEAAVPRPRQRPAAARSAEPEFLAEVAHQLEGDAPADAVALIGKNKRLWLDHEQEVVALLLQAAERATEAGDYALAERAYLLATQADPGDSRLRSARDRARRKAESQQRERDELLAAADRAAKEGDEQAAVANLEKVVQLKKTDAEAKRLLADARLRLALSNVMTRVGTAYREADWDTVLDGLVSLRAQEGISWEALASRAPAEIGRSPGDMISDARVGLLRERKLPIRTLYSLSVTGMQRLTISPDGVQLAVWGPSGAVQVLWLSNGDTLQRFDHRQGRQRPELSSLTFEQNALWIVTAYGKAEISRWRAGTNQRIFRTARTATTVAPLLHPLVAVGAGTSVDVWDVASGQFQFGGFEHDRRIVDMVTAGSVREMLLTVTDDKIRLWSVPHAEALITRELPGKAARLAVDAHARSVAVSLKDGRVTFWTRIESDDARLLPGVSAATALDISPDGRMLAVVDGGTVRMWDLHRGEELPAPGTADDVIDLRFVPDGWRLVTVNRTHVTVHTWERPRKTTPMSLETW